MVMRIPVFLTLLAAACQLTPPPPQVASQHALGPPVPDVATPAATSTVPDATLSGTAMAFRGPMANASITVLDMIRHRLLATAVSDELGHFSLPLPQEQPFLVTAKQADSTVLTIATGMGPIVIDPHTTLATKLIGSKLTEAVVSATSQERQDTALATLDALTRSIKTLLEQEILDVPLLNALVAAKDDFSPPKAEKLADRIFMDTPLKSTILDAVERFNQEVTGNLRQGGQPVIPGRWQRGDTTIPPALVTLINGQLIVNSGEVTVQESNAAQTHDPFSLFNRLAGNANTYFKPRQTPPSPVRPPFVLFNSNRDGDHEIYLIRQDGTDLTQLTFNGQSDSGAKWSPDGRKIAFQSIRDGDYEIYVMNRNGSNQTRLTNAVGSDIAPRWSPDGQRIAFYSSRDGNNEIYVMDADGANQTRLTNAAGHDIYPVWSPDSQRIAFYSTRDGDNEIYVMDADGTNLIQLTNNAVDDNTASFSPDGQKILFDSKRDGDWEVYVMDADGSNQTRLTTTAGADGNGVWSPDGSRIAFTSNRDGNQEIYVMNADGSNQTRMSNQPGIDTSVSWSSAGNRLIFQNNQTGNYDIYLVNADGSGLFQLTNDPAHDATASFAP